MRLAKLVSLCSLSLIIGGAASAAVPFAYLPSDPAEQSLEIAQRHQVSQVKLANCNGESPHSQMIGSNKLTVHSNGDVVVQGTDSKGKAWSASLRTAPVADCEIWQADLNGDGQNDLILLNFGTNSSGGWDTHLSLLLFGREGSPFPWQATGNFHVNQRGVAELVILPEVPGVSVIVPQREGDAFSGYSYAYTALNISADRLSKLSDSSWPLFTGPSNTIRKSQELNDLSTKVDKTHSNVPAARAIALTGKDESEYAIRTSDGNLLQEPRIIVSDSRLGARTIVFTPDLSDLRHLVEQRATLNPLGTSCDQDQCQPLVLWSRF